MLFDIVVRRLVLQVDMGSLVFEKYLKSMEQHQSQVQPGPWPGENHVNKSMFELWLFLCPVLCFLPLGRSESGSRFRDLQKSVVILSRRAVWIRSIIFLIKQHYPLKANVDPTFEFLALRRSGTCRCFRDLQKSIIILSNGAVWTGPETWHSW